MNDLDFSNKTVLVTGSGRNIGRAVILEFAERGANVVINARSNVDEVRAVEEEAKKFDVGTLVVMGDASDLRTVTEMKEQAEKRFGRVDMYVSNAARRLFKSFFETTNEDWHQFLNQQLTASWYLAKAFAPAMRDAEWGRIIHINGADGWLGGASRIPHSTAKGGLRTLTKSLAASLGQFGITVNDVSPGFTDTIRDPETHPHFTAGNTAATLEQIPTRRQPSTADLAWACAFLCSPRSSSITGSVIHVDGGQFMLG